MNKRWVAGILALAWVALFPAGQAAAFDWNAPVQTVEHLLDRVRHIAKPGGIAVTPGDPAKAGSNPAATSAPAGRSAPPPSAGSPPPEAPSRSSDGHETREEAGPTQPDSADTVLLEKVLLSPEPYSYESAGRRDPFVSLVDAGDGAETTPDQAAADQLTVRGILWGENDRFALVENGAGNSFILRQGDHCGRFTVTKIQPDAIQVYSSQYGVGKTQSLPLIEEKGSKHALPQR